MEKKFSFKPFCPKFFYGFTYKKDNAIALEKDIKSVQVNSLSAEIQPLPKHIVFVPLTEAEQLETLQHTIAEFEYKAVMSQPDMKHSVLGFDSLLENLVSAIVSPIIYQPETSLSR